MTYKIQALVFIIALYIPVSYSIETPAGAPGEADALLGRKSLDGVDAINKENIVENMKDMIPKYENYLQMLKKHMAETPETTPAEQCLNLCFEVYEKEIGEFKKYADVLAISATGEVDFQSETNKEDLTKCDLCLVEVTKEDPKIAQDTEWFISEFDKVGKNVNIYNS